jgi:hypothetical protein
MTCGVRRATKSMEESLLPLCCCAVPSNPTVAVAWDTLLRVGRLDDDPSLSLPLRLPLALFTGRIENDGKGNAMETARKNQ